MKKYLTLFIIATLLLLTFACSKDDPLQNLPASDPAETEVEEPEVEKPEVEKPETEEPKAQKVETEEKDAEESEAEIPEQETSETEEPTPEEPDLNLPEKEAPVTEQPKPEEPKAEIPTTEQIQETVFLGNKSDAELLELARVNIEKYFELYHKDDASSIGAQLSNEDYLCFCGPIQENKQFVSGILTDTIQEGRYFENEDFKFGSYFGFIYEGIDYELELYTGKIHNLAGEDISSMYITPEGKLKTSMLLLAKKITNYSSKDEIKNAFAEYISKDFLTRGMGIYVEELAEYGGALYEIFNRYEGRGRDPDANIDATAFYDTAKVVSRTNNSFAIKCNFGYPGYTVGANIFTFGEENGKIVITAYQREYAPM